MLFSPADLHGIHLRFPNAKDTGAERLPPTIAAELSANQQELPIRDIIRHIIVALDASPHSLALLEAAAELAARFHTEVVGLFIEDATLVNLAGSPFFREVSRFSATSRVIWPLWSRRRCSADMAARWKPVG